MIDKKCYYVGQSKYSFKPGVPLLVTGLKMYNCWGSSKDNQKVPCFKLHYRKDNGVSEYIFLPVDDILPYKLVGSDEPLPEILD